MSDESNERQPPASLSRHEQFEYTRLIQMLDYKQHIDLPAHLYSAYLLSKRKRKVKPGKRPGRNIPHNKWTAWPLKDAPAPPQIYDDMPDDEPTRVDDAYLEKLRESATESFPTPPSPSENPEKPLIRACEEFLQRTINQRVLNDDRGCDLEPVVEPQPHLDEATAARLVQLIDKYAIPLPPESVHKRHKPIDWEHIGIRGEAARNRIKQLFNRQEESDLDDLDEPYDETTDSLNTYDSASARRATSEQADESMLKSEQDGLSEESE